MINSPFLLYTHPARAGLVFPRAYVPALKTTGIKRAYTMYRVVGYSLEKLSALPARFWFHGKKCPLIYQKCRGCHNVTVPSQWVRFFPPSEGTQNLLFNGPAWWFLNFMPHQTKAILCRTQCALEKDEGFVCLDWFDRASRDSTAISNSMRKS